MSTPVDALTWGTAQPDNNVTVYFTTSGQWRAGYSSEGFNAYEKAQFQKAFDAIEAVCGLTFTVTNDSNADFQLVLDTNQMGDDELGFFVPPDTGIYSGIGVFNGALWDRSAGGRLEKGGFSYVTIVHEILHGLGLAHPHDGGGSSTVMPGVTDAFDDYGPHELNQGVFTTMTYNSGHPLGEQGDYLERFGYEAGPMALDIAVLQNLYGTGGQYRAGHNVYVLPDQDSAGTYWQAIWDTGGNDEIRSDSARDVTIDLRAATLEYAKGGGGFVSSANGIPGGFTIANGVVIENARGGSGDDRLVGNGQRNTLIGRNGDDTLFGNSGNDALAGGQGADRLIGGNGNDWLRGDAGKDQLLGGDGQDRLLGSDGGDRLLGQSGSDRLFGGDGDDRLYGGNGSDTIAGNSGQDLLFGGYGADVFDFNLISDSRTQDHRHDIIGDFTLHNDKIDLSTLDANRNINGDQAFYFIGGFDFTGRGGEVHIVEQGANTLVQTDINGDGKAELEILLLNTSDVNWTHFIL